MHRLLNVRVQIVSSWILFWGSIVGWPVTALTVFRHEPQGILGLSWLALVISSYTTLVSAYGNRMVADLDGDGV